MKKVNLFFCLTAGLICVIFLNLFTPLDILKRLIQKSINLGVSMFISLIFIVILSNGVNLCFAQNFGVGTNTPNSKLHVVQDSSQNAFRVDDEQGDTTPFIIDSVGNVEAGGRIKDQTGFLMPVGAIISYAGATAPEGWLLCNGDTVLRTTYSDLFTAIGTAWGEGDSVTTFHLPDLRGRFARGVDNGAGNDPDAVSRIESNAGGNIGDTVGSYQGDVLTSHNHGGTASTNGSHNHSGQTSGGKIPAQPQQEIIDSYNNYSAMSGYVSYVWQAYSTNRSLSINSSGNHNHTISSDGGNETRPKNVYVNFIIKY